MPTGGKTEFGLLARGPLLNPMLPGVTLQLIYDKPING
jgi:hypothetical protein